MLRASESLIDVILERCGQAPDRACLVFIGDDGQPTIVHARELARQILQCAAALSRHGVVAGDSLVVALDHGPALVTVFLGAIYLGATPCIFPAIAPKLDPGAYEQRLAFAVRRLDTKLIVTQDGAAKLEATPCAVVDLRSLLADMDSQSASPPAGHSRCAFLQLSSGTTGHQKVIQIEHRAIVNLVAARDAALAVTADDVVVGWVPFYHDLGLVGSVLAPLVSGVTSVVISPLYWLMRPASLLQAIHRYRGTICTMPNFAFHYCARRVQDAELAGVDLAHWRVLYNSAEPIRPESFTAFANRFSPWGFDPAAFVTGYGLAENTLTVTMAPLRRPPRVDWIDRATLQEHRRAEPQTASDAASAVVSCGQPLANVTLQIRSPSGAVLPDRHVGEVVVRSNCLFASYLHDQAATAAALRDGWLHTGDLGYIVDGELYICGREKDLISVAGRKIHAEDVELIASRVDGVRAGRVAAFGIEDVERGTETIVVLGEVAAEVRRDGTDIERDIRQRIKKELDVAVGCVEVVDAGWIVKTTSGKVARWQNRSKWLAQRDRAAAPLA